MPGQLKIKLLVLLLLLLLLLEVCICGGLKDYRVRLGFCKNRTFVSKEINRGNADISDAV
jgi:hypothetical protein